MRKLRLPFLALLCICMAVSCISRPYARHYFTLAFDKMPPASGDPPSPIHQRILVESPGVDPVYDSFRIIYRPSSFQFNYYPYDFWIREPAKLVEDFIFRFLSTLSCFDAVLCSTDERHPTRVISSRVEVMEEVAHDVGSSAHLKMSIRVLEYPSRREILVHRFDRSEPLSIDDGASLPRGLSQILRRELLEVVRKMAADGGTQ